MKTLQVAICVGSVLATVATPPIYTNKLINTDKKKRTLKKKVGEDGLSETQTSSTDSNQTGKQYCKNILVYFIIFLVMSYDALVNVHFERITNHHTNPFVKMLVSSVKCR